MEHEHRETAAAGQAAIPIRLDVHGATLEGDLRLPPAARGLVIFAHGSGSSRHSLRNRYVAQMLNEGGLATLLLDLLTVAEERADRETANLRFDIDLLAERLVAAADWAAGQPRLRDLMMGYFGASTGGGAALVAAGQRPELIRAVVSRGGRPDLAGPHLQRVRAPTLLIVGGLDLSVLRLNRQALLHMGCERQLEVVPGASHLFEEQGALEQVARLSRAWFQRYLGAASAVGG